MSKVHCSLFPLVDTLVLNLDNGPENHSRRTQFIARLIEFADGQYCASHAFAFTQAAKRSTVTSSASSSKAFSVTGWVGRFDNPTQLTVINLCPQSCNTVQADPNAEVKIPIACQGS